MSQRIINLDAIEIQTPSTYKPSDAAAAKYDMRMGAIATRIGAGEGESG